MIALARFLSFVTAALEFVCGAGSPQRGGPRRAPAIQNLVGPRPPRGVATETFCKPARKLDQQKHCRQPERSSPNLNAHPRYQSKCPKLKPGYLKAARLENVGESSLVFSAESDPRVLPRSPGSAPHVHHVYRESAPQTKSKTAPQHT